MNVKSLMTKHAKTCRATDMLNAAARIMWDYDCGSVPVVNDKDEVIGMLTDRDICMAAYLRNQPIDGMMVGSVMSKKIFGCSPDDSLEVAEQIMQQHQVRRLPVLGPGGRLLGILSLNDLVRAVAEKKRDQSPGMNAAAIEETLAAVCRPRKRKTSQGVESTSAA